MATTHTRSNFNPIVHLDVFAQITWPGVMLVGIVVASVLFLMEKSERNDHWKFIRALVMVSLHLIQMGDNYSGRRAAWSVRLAFLTSAAFGYLLFASYCSLLTSTMTMTPEVPTIKSFEDAYVKVCVRLLHVSYLF